MRTALTVLTYGGLVIASLSSVWGTLHELTWTDTAGKRRLTVAGKASITLTLLALLLSATCTFLENRMKERSAWFGVRWSLHTSRTVEVSEFLINGTLERERPPDDAYFKVIIRDLALGRGQVNQSRAIRTYVETIRGESSVTVALHLHNFKYDRPPWGSMIEFRTANFQIEVNGWSDDSLTHAAYVLFEDRYRMYLPAFSSEGDRLSSGIPELRELKQQVIKDALATATTADVSGPVTSLDSK